MSASEADIDQGITVNTMEPYSINVSFNLKLTI